MCIAPASDSSVCSTTSKSGNRNLTALLLRIRPCNFRVSIAGNVITTILVCQLATSLVGISKNRTVRCMTITLKGTLFHRHRMLIGIVIAGGRAGGRSVSVSAIFYYPHILLFCFFFLTISSCSCFFSRLVVFLFYFIFSFTFVSAV